MIAARRRFRLLVRKAKRTYVNRNPMDKWLALVVLLIVSLLIALIILFPGWDQLHVVKTERVFFEDLRGGNGTNGKHNGSQATFQWTTSSTARPKAYTNYNSSESLLTRKDNNSLYALLLDLAQISRVNGGRMRSEAVDSSPFRARPTSAKEHPGAGRSSAWLDLSTSVLHAQTSAGAEMLFPVIYPSYRDRRKESVKADGGSSYEKWAFMQSPVEPMHLPKFANDKERNTLQHASIFISIAAYRDPECADTVANILSKAKHPHRLYFGLSEEREPNERSCLEPFGMKELVYQPETGFFKNKKIAVDEMTEAKALLYGAGAPIDKIQLEKRFYTWKSFLKQRVVYNNDIESGAQQNTQDRKDPSEESVGADDITPKLVANYANFDLYSTRVTKEYTVFAASVQALASAVPSKTIFFNERYEDDRIVCLAGEPEILRDRFRLALNDIFATGKLNERNIPSSLKVNQTLLKELSELVAFRKGKGGAQEGPFPAMAGCRVTSRLANWYHARGPTYSRYVTSLFYFQQDYFMVIDSHSRFSLHFDPKMIMRVYQTPTRAVLSHYPNGFDPFDAPEDMEREIHWSVMQMCYGCLQLTGVPTLQAEYVVQAEAPVLEVFAAAGYMFGDAYYVIQNPFDPFLPYLFDGEEALYSARLWTSGIDIYCPTQANILHHYTRAAPRDWEAMVNAAHLKASSIRRFFYISRFVKPWRVVLEDFEKKQQEVQRADPARAAEMTPPTFSPPSERFYLPREEARGDLHNFVFAEYYGLGSVRSVSEYWTFAELTDEFVTEKKAEENLWIGGRSKCLLNDPNYRPSSVKR